jgi:hypothetical protein
MGHAERSARRDAMRSSTVLRLCLVLEWVLFLAGLGLSFATERFLPEPLRAWLDAEAEGDPSVREMAFFGLCILLVASGIVGTVGLFLLQRWAAWLYLVNSILGVLLTLLAGPAVEHPLTDAIGEVASIMCGMVIALAFFSDALKKQRAESPIPRVVAETAPRVS